SGVTDYAGDASERATMASPFFFSPVHAADAPRVSPRYDHAMPPPSDDDVKYLQCMEVWGGNQVVDSGVVMAGLDAWVYSRPVNDDEGGGDVHYVSSCAAGM